MNCCKWKINLQSQPRQNHDFWRNTKRTCIIFSLCLLLICLLWCSICNVLLLKGGFWDWSSTTIVLGKSRRRKPSRSPCHRPLLFATTLCSATATVNYSGRTTVEVLFFVALLQALYHDELDFPIYRFATHFCKDFASSCITAPNFDVADLYIFYLVCCTA